MGSAKRWKPAKLAAKLLEIRESLHLSQGGMVKALNVGNKANGKDISAFELGKREPPLPILLRYAQLAGVSVNDLIDDDVSLRKQLRKRELSGYQGSVGSSKKPPDIVRLILPEATLRPEDLVSQTTAAKLRGVAKQSILSLIQRGRLRTVVIDRHTFLIRSEVERFRPEKGGRPKPKGERKE